MKPNKEIRKIKVKVFQRDAREPFSTLYKEVLTLNTQDYFDLAEEYIKFMGFNSIYVTELTSTEEGIYNTYFSHALHSGRRYKGFMILKVEVL